MVAPMVGSQLVPMRIRVVVAVAIALIVAPLLPEMPAVEVLSLSTLLIIAQQILIGTALGFFLQMVLQTLVLAGQMIAMQMGLGFASMVDPSNRVNVTVVSSFYLMFITALFVALDGHLVMIEVLIDSFYTLPINSDFSFAQGSVLSIVNSISWVFASAMVIALPAISALLITNFAFGIMTRAAPQLNIFTLGFPVALMFGLTLLWMTLPMVAELATELFADGFERMRTYISP